MLKGIDPILTPELLFALRAMGHGDEIAIVDANYPAESAGTQVIRLPGSSAVQALDAVLSLMPLDDFEPESAWRMEVVGAPKREEPIFDEFRKTIAARAGERFKLGRVERFRFYDRVADCFAVVATGETRLYGNVILKKGVIRSE
ncbi:MAG: ribose ABC transporter [Hyphomicrobiales bacterium]|nr:ribose ABC transporter [Hyphomicrobiales bacterium]MDE2016578.1 ribose ABC transporter [Hyphomicrobiales bacterium]